MRNNVNCHRDRGGRGRSPELWLLFGPKNVNSHRDRERVVVAKSRRCHFGTRLASLRSKSLNSHRDRGGHGRKAQNCRNFLDSPLEREKERGERKEMRGKRGEKRRGEWIEERRDERRGERRERRGERIEEGRERGEEREVRR